MNAFEPLRIQEAGRIPQQHPSIPVNTGDGEPSAIRQRLCTVAKHLSAFKKASREWMLFEGLEGVVRIGARVFIVEAGDVADGNLRIADAVNPRAAVFFCGQRPAESVDYLAFLDASCWDSPQLVHSQTVGLRVFGIFQTKALDQLFGAVAAWAFGEDGDFGAQVISRLKVCFGLALLVHAFVIGAHASYARQLRIGAVAGKQKLGSCESGKDGDACFFYLLAHPLDELVQRDDIVAVVAQRRRNDGQLTGLVFAEEIDGLLQDLGIERRFLFESRKKLPHGARVEQSSGEAVLADFAGLFEHVDVVFGKLRIGMAGVMLVYQLSQAQRAGHPCRASADDDNVGFHLRAFDSFERFAEDNHKRVTSQANASRRPGLLVVFDKQESCKASRWRGYP